MDEKSKLWRISVNLGYNVKEERGKYIRFMKKVATLAQNLGILGDLAVVSKKYFNNIKDNYSLFSIEDKEKGDRLANLLLIEGLAEKVIIDEFPFRH